MAAEPTDIAVITCVFNPAGYRQPRENFARFAAKLDRDGVPWYAIELAFYDRPFSLPKIENIFQYRSRSVLWHKENLLNVLASKLPRRFTKIIWLDGDLIFSGCDWWQRASEALERYTVIQPFETASWWARDGATVHKTKKSLLHHFVDSHDELVAGKIDLARCSLGFAWAARRELFEAGGLFAYAILGGGDTCMALAFSGLKDARFEWPGRLGRHLDAYAATMLPVVEGRLGYLPGISVHHMWHGEARNRRYFGRRRTLAAFDYDPLIDLAKDADGMWQWASDKPALHRAVCEYFEQRREDPTWWQRILNLGG